jgi:hypothetical protein
VPYAAFLPGVAPVTYSNTTAFLVQKNGTVIASLLDATEPDANVGLLEWDENGGAASFSLPVTSDAAADLVEKAEVQFHRNGLCIWWGYLERLDYNHLTVTAQCVGLVRYFDFRYFGKANRTNYLTNGQFESDGTGWTAVGVTASYSTSDRILGTKSALLEQAGGNTDTYLEQIVQVAGGSIGLYLTLAAWFNVGLFGRGDAALEGRGLFLGIADSTDRGHTWFPIDADTPGGVWQRAEVGITVPPNETLNVVVRLYAPVLSIRWDAVSLTAMESFSNYRVDQATIAAGISDYAQDRGAFVHGKSDLNIAATSATCPATGILRDYHQQFADAANVGRSLREFSELDDGFEVSVEHTSTARALHTWYPSKGVDRTGSVTITNDMLVDGPFGLRFDGEQGASSIRVLGDGDGPDREEGGATDTSLFGGTTFEQVLSVPPNTPIDRLASMAAEQLRAWSDPRTCTVTMPEPEVLLLEVVKWGDIITMDIDHGALQIQGAWRVVAVRFDPVTEALSFECVPDTA